nr:IS110 family transposase [Pandoraea oxalativorans]
MDDRAIEGEVILGVDTHLDTHVGALISETGKLVGTLSVAAETTGYLKLLTWANSLGHVRRAGVEGTGTYGAGLARVLRDHDIDVLEVNRPDRAARRSRGKSDPTDAENAARAVLAGRATAIPKEQSGAAEAMRTVSVARRSAVGVKVKSGVRGVSKIRRPGAAEPVCCRSPALHP